MAARSSTCSYDKQDLNVDAMLLRDDEIIDVVLIIAGAFPATARPFNHWLVHGHMTCKSGTDSRQMP